MNIQWNIRFDEHMVRASVIAELRACDADKVTFDQAFLNDLLDNKNKGHIVILDFSDCAVSPWD